MDQAPKKVVILDEMTLKYLNLGPEGVTAVFEGLDGNSYQSQPMSRYGEFTTLTPEMLRNAEDLYKEGKVDDG